jgi:uncharacterized membrane protein YjgN (DUF898 family)
MTQTDEVFEGQEIGFYFTGSWREYLPIALSNFALTVASLGIYRFWAKSRERRYLWRHTIFVDEPLEWTGNGRELLLGFIFAILILSPLLLFIRFGFEVMTLEGHDVAAAGLLALVYVLLVYVRGLGRFRGLRYRLSRTYWRGIRGGSAEGGFGYGLSYLWRTVLGYLPIGLLIPWTMTTTWNGRWRAMGFGSEAIGSGARARPLIRRYLLFYTAPFALVVLGVIAAGIAYGEFPLWGPLILTFEAPLYVRILMFAGTAICVYLLFAFLLLSYYAAYLQEVISGLSWGEVEFTFEATSDDWFNLFIVDMLLIVATLGIGFIFIGYRHWSFFIRNLVAHGTLRPGAIAQSTARAPNEAEGLMDALDLGAV